jgi:hypothetical protein
MPLHYFIYYRVRPQAIEPATAAVATLQARLAAACGIAGRCLRRADDAGSLMEIYEGVADPAAFERSLDALVRDSGVMEWLVAGEQRHMEKFIPCA